MSLVPKRGGKKTACLISARLYERAVRFAEKEEFALWSVIETALEEFLDDREDDGSDKAPPKLNGGVAAMRGGK